MIVVAAAPHMLFLKDTDGDGKADVRQILSTGWGIRDTHAGPSNLQYGPDNYIWGSVGYSGFDGEMNGKKLQFTQGTYRFKPDGSDFEYVTMSTNNTWGLGFSENFDVFGSTANNDPSFFVAIPNRFFEGVRGPAAGARQRPRLSERRRSSTRRTTRPRTSARWTCSAATPPAPATTSTPRARSRRSTWNRIAFISEPTAHLVGQGIIESQGAGFVTRDGWNLLSGAEEWVAPVHAQVGPDGAVWVSDWYNFIAQHNPTPMGYVNGKRQRLRAAAARSHARPHLPRRLQARGAGEEAIAVAPPTRAGLLEALASDNMFWRLHAQRLLVERGQKDVVPQLVALVRNKTVDEVGINGGAFHALWTLQGLGETANPASEGYKAAVEALKHPAAGVRKAAAMVLPKTPEAASRDRRRRAAAGSGSPHAAGGGPGHRRDAERRRRSAARSMPSRKKPENFNDRWLSRALYIAATQAPRRRS